MWPLQRNEDLIDMRFTPSSYAMLEVDHGSEAREEKEYNRCKVMLLGISSRPLSVNAVKTLLRFDGSRLF